MFNLLQILEFIGYSATTSENLIISKHVPLDIVIFTQLHSRLPSSTNFTH